MMVQSMTGFATAHLTWQSSNITLPMSITIKALNSRFLETTCRIPHVLAPLEQEITHQCKQALKRGNITVVIHLGSIHALRTLTIPPVGLVQQYVQKLQTLQEQCKLGGEVTLRDLIAMPHLFESAEAPLPEACDTFILQQVSQLLNEVVQGRIREGKALHHDLISALEIIHACVNELEPRAAIISHDRRTKFLESVSEALSTVTPDLKQQHIQALYQQINAIDVHEEIVRIRTHHAEFLKTLTDSEAQKGKKLDFTLQELLREINTLSAKLNDAQSITPILTIKTKLEQAREQVQNIV